MNKRARLTSENAGATFTSLKGLMAPVDAESDMPTGQTIEVELARLRPNPDQPRRSTSAGMSKSSIEELAENIKAHGVLQPLLVKDTGRFYQIIAGERRFRACQLIGLERVPVRLVEPQDDQAELQISLAENLQRKNLSVLDEAFAFRTLIQQYGLSYRDLSRLSGRSLAHIHGRLQLLEYDDVRQAVEGKRIGVVDAVTLAKVPDEAQRKDLIAAAQEGTLRGAALQRQVQVFLGELSPEIAAEQEELHPAGLSDALQIVESSSPEASDEERRTLYEIAARAAGKLGLTLVSTTVVNQVHQRADEARPRQLTAPPPINADSRRIISRVKDYRSTRGHTIVNLIRAFWMNMEKRGYVFSPGEWSASPGESGSYIVRFSYMADAEPRVMEWIYGEGGDLQPANEDARALMS